MVDTKSQKVGTIEDYVTWFFILFVSFICFSTLIIQKLFNCVFYSLNYTHQFPIFWDFLSHFPKLSLLFSKFFSDAFCSIFLLKMALSLISSLTLLWVCVTKLSRLWCVLSCFCGYFPHRFFPLYIPSVRTGSPFLWSWSVERVSEIALVIGLTFLTGFLLPLLSRSISDAVCRMFFSEMSMSLISWLSFGSSESLPTTLKILMLFLVVSVFLPQPFLSPFYHAVPCSLLKSHLLIQ